MTLQRLIDYGIATEVKDADAPTLPNSITSGVLNVTIPFGRFILAIR